eukprot:7209614-Lingulodinium_polyedra.AAC.1
MGLGWVPVLDPPFESVVASMGCALGCNNPFFEGQQFGVCTLVPHGRSPVHSPHQVPLPHPFGQERLEASVKDVVPHTDACVAPVPGHGQDVLDAGKVGIATLAPGHWDGVSEPDHGLWIP